MQDFIVVDVTCSTHEARGQWFSNCRGCLAQRSFKKIGLVSDTWAEQQDQLVVVWSHYTGEPE